MVTAKRTQWPSDLLDRLRRGVASLLLSARRGEIGGDRKRVAGAESESCILKLRLTVLGRSGVISRLIDERPRLEPLPDLSSLSDAELKNLIGELQKQEQEVSYTRRILHGKIDILRAELVARLQESGGQSVFDHVDVERLTEILTGKAAPPA
jgi:hypothetical protein